MKELVPRRCVDLPQTVNSYEPPHIEILEIEVEKGFADSAGDFEETPW